VVKDVDVMGAWYHFTQPTYGVGCTSATAATCCGTEDAFSGVSGRREPGAVRAEGLRTCDLRDAASVRLTECRFRR
jgi:hypothetical protein